MLHAVRVFWIAMLVMSACSLLYISSLLLAKLQNPSYIPETKIEFVSPEDGIRFPRVTVCNYNQIRKSVAISEPLILAYLEELLIGLNSSDAASLDHFWEETGSERIMEIGQDEETLNTIENLLLSAAPLPLDFVYHLTIEGYPVINRYAPNNSRDFLQRTLTDTGPCVTLKSNDDSDWWFIKQEGAQAGVSVFLDLQAQESFFQIGQEGDLKGGVKLAIHYEDEPPSMYADYIKLHPGHDYDIALDVSEVLMNKLTIINVITKPSKKHELPIYSTCEIRRLDLVSTLATRTL